MGARKMNRKADRWGPAGSDSRRSGRARGRERRVGPAHGPRACALGGRRAQLGWLGREAEQAEAACEASLFFFFFYFVFLLLRLEFKFILEFEFKSGGVFVIQNS